jgi:hypothetical protein
MQKPQRNERRGNCGKGVADHDDLVKTPQRERCPRGASKVKKTRLKVRVKTYLSLCWQHLLP